MKWNEFSFIHGTCFIPSGKYFILVSFCFLATWNVISFSYGRCFIQCFIFVDPRFNQYFTVPHLFLQESGHSSGILQESSHSTGIPLDKNGIKQTKVEILIYLSQFLRLCRYVYFSLSLPFLHNVYSSTLPLKFNFKQTLFLRLVELKYIEWDY